SFAGSGWSAKLPESLAAVVRRREAGPLLLGIRPEDVQIGLEAAGATNGDRLTAEAALVESTGDASIVQLVGLAQEGAARIAVEESSILCKLDARLRLSSGNRTPIVFNMARVHLFDALTGENVALAENVKGN